MKEKISKGKQILELYSDISIWKKTVSLILTSSFYLWETMPQSDK